MSIQDVMANNYITSFYSKWWIKFQKYIKKAFQKNHDTDNGVNKSKCDILAQITW